MPQGSQFTLPPTAITRCQRHYTITLPVKAAICAIIVIYPARVIIGSVRRLSGHWASVLAHNCPLRYIAAIRVLQSQATLSVAANAAILPLNVNLRCRVPQFGVGAVGCRRRCGPELNSPIPVSLFTLLFNFHRKSCYYTLVQY